MQFQVRYIFENGDSVDEVAFSADDLTAEQTAVIEQAFTATKIKIKR